jgi:hypothetical protein
MDTWLDDIKSLQEDHWFVLGRNRFPLNCGNPFYFCGIAYLASIGALTKVPHYQQFPLWLSDCFFLIW